MHPPTPAPRSSKRRLPREVWALGFVSLFMDVSSELVHAVLPLFLTTVLGASMMTIGVLEGVAEATASITKLFSGALSDRWRRRKWLVTLGYGLSALTKPVFPLAGSVLAVFGARFVDRIGKGIRGAPRDALLADITPVDQRGAAFGLRQALDSVGAFVGPVLAVVLLAAWAQDLRAVLWFAVIPAVLAVVVLVLAVREPEVLATTPRGVGLGRAAMRQLSARYWEVVALAVVFTLARFSEAFLLLRAQHAGLSIGWIPLVMIVLNVVYAASAYPAGVLADRWGTRGLLLGGLLMLIGADVVLAVAPAAWMVLVGAGLWGLHLGLSQGLLAKLVADTAPAHLRATAFGVFHLSTGMALLGASLLAGALWEHFGPAATFLAGAGFALVAALGLLILRPHPRPPAEA